MFNAALRRVADVALLFRAMFAHHIVLTGFIHALKRDLVAEGPDHVVICYRNGEGQGIEYALIPVSLAFELGYHFAQSRGHVPQTVGTVYFQLRFFITCGNSLGVEYNFADGAGACCR